MYVYTFMDMLSVSFVSLFQITKTLCQHQMGFQPVSMGNQEC